MFVAVKKEHRAAPRSQCPRHVREVAKMAAKAGETAKVSVRNARKKGMDAIKRAKMPEDEAKRAEKEVQKSHDAFVKRCQDLTVAKEKAIMAA